MEQQKKNLAATSWIILGLTILHLANSIAKACTGGLDVNTLEIPAGFTKELVGVVVICAWVVSLIGYLPALYLSYKGLKISKNPDGSKAHILWAMVLIVLDTIAVVSAFGALFQSANLVNDILALISNGCVLFLYVVYYLEAKKIRANV